MERNYVTATLCMYIYRLHIGEAVMSWKALATAHTSATPHVVIFRYRRAAGALTLTVTSPNLNNLSLVNSLSTYSANLMKIHAYSF